MVIRADGRQADSRHRAAPHRLAPLLVLSAVVVPAHAHGQTTVVEGIVVDSTHVLEPADAPRPLSRARVWARGLDEQVETDAGGRFRLELPAPGTYELTFHHPRLDTIGVESMGWSRVSVAEDGAPRAELATPSWTTLFGLWCGRDLQRAEAEGVVAGWVRSTLDGSPLEGIAAELRPTGGAEAGPAFAARSADDGLFLFCSVPAEVRYRLDVDAFGLDVATEEVRVGAGEIRQASFEFEVGGEGTLEGRVRSGDGEPVTQAVVELEGPSSWTAVTDASGGFRAEGLPAGRYRLEVRHLAFREIRRELAVPGADRTVNVEVRLLRDAIALDPLVVEVEGRRPRPTWGFVVDAYERMDWMRKLGLGRFYDRYDIERSGAIRISHLLSRQVGVRHRARPGSPELFIYLNHRRCQPTIYVDGIRQRGDALRLDDVHLSEVELLEVYRRITELPGEFWDANATRCGAVAIWTRRGH